MFCKQCGKVVDASAIYCTGCGIKISEDGSAEINSDLHILQTEKRHSGGTNSGLSSITKLGIWLIVFFIATFLLCLAQLNIWIDIPIGAIIGYFVVSLVAKKQSTQPHG